MATVIADQVYGYNSNDATINFFDAIESEKGSNNTLVFRDMGTPWKVSPCLRIFNVDDLTIIFEDGFVLEELPLYAEKNDRRRYFGITKLKNSYPNGTLGTNAGGQDYELNEKSKLFWVSGCNNLIVKAYGAEFIGVFPTIGNGLSPSTSAGRDYSWEFNHFVQIDSPTTFTWSGGYIHNWGGDGFNVIKMIDDCYIEDCKIYYNKRLGTQSHSVQGKLVITDCDISKNGRGENVNTDFGTNTRQGATWEPNTNTESLHGEMRNCRFQENGDSGIGLHPSKSDNSSSGNIRMTVEDCHFEGNNTQVDDRWSSAIALAGTNIFSEPSNERGTKPLGGFANFNRNVVWGDNNALLFTSLYKGSYSINFDDTVVYKPSTLGVGRSGGIAIIDWTPVASTPNGTKLANLDIGNMLVVHDKDDFFIDLNNSSNVDEIENSVTGNLTFATSSTKPLISIQSPLTNNSTIAETRYGLSNLPDNTVSVTASVSNAVKSTNTNGQFTFTRTGSTDFPTGVYYTVTTNGTNAEELNDFKLLRGSIVIPTGQSSVTQAVIPLNPDRTGGERNIILTVQPREDLYNIGTNQAMVILSDVPSLTSVVGFNQNVYDSHSNPTIPSGALYASTLPSYNSNNPTVAYYEALESNNSFVVIDNVGNGEWAIDPKRVFGATAKTIVYEEGVVLKDRGSYPNNFTSLIDFSNSDGIEIYGYGAEAQLTRIGLTGEANHGVHIKSSDNVIFKGFKLIGIGTPSDRGGDGFKTGSVDSNHNPCNNLLVEDLIIDNHSRLGIALTNDIGTIVRNVKITGTNGRWPSGGIDIEPDNYQMKMDNVLLENITITGCDANAFQLGLYFMNTEYVNDVQTQRPNFSNNITLTLRNSYFYNNNLDLNKTTHGNNNNRFPETENNLGDVRWGVLTGLVTYDNVIVENDIYHAFYVSKRTASYEVELNNVTINSSNLHEEPFKFNERSGDGRTIGGVSLTDMVLTTTNPTSFSEIILQGNSTLEDMSGNVFHISPTTNDINFGANANQSKLTNYNIIFDSNIPPINPPIDLITIIPKKRSNLITYINN